MKKYLIIPFLSLVLSLGSAVTASAQIKIGTVDMKKVFESYWRTKEAETKMSETRATLKRDLDERNEKRKELQDGIEKLNEEVKKPELSKEKAQTKLKEREDKIAEWQNMMRELQQYQAEKEKQLADQTMRIRNGLVEEIKKVIDAKVKSGGYDLVFDSSGNSINNVPMVLYSKESYDFTKDVVDQLNADRPKGGASEKPAAPEKPAGPKGAK
jgi:outer membrane protein